MAPTGRSPEGPHQGMAVWLFPALGTSLPSQSLQRISNPPTPPPQPPSAAGGGIPTRLPGKEQHVLSSWGRSNSTTGRAP